MPARPAGGPLAYLLSWNKPLSPEGRKNSLLTRYYPNSWPSKIVFQYISRHPYRPSGRLLPSDHFRKKYRLMKVAKRGPLPCEIEVTTNRVQILSIISRGLPCEIVVNTEGFADVMRYFTGQVSVTVWPRQCTCRLGRWRESCNAWATETTGTRKWSEATLFWYFSLFAVIV